MERYKISVEVPTFILYYEKTKKIFNKDRKDLENLQLKIKK